MRSCKRIVISMIAIAIIAGCSGETEPPVAKDGAPSTRPQKDQSALRLRVTGLRNSKGQVLATLFDSESGFPFDPDRAFRKLELKIRNGEAVGTFEDVPYGVYAISVLHDENGDRKLNKNFLGIPKEGVGATGEKTFGAPKFKTAKFEFNRDNTEQTVALRYY